MAAYLLVLTVLGFSLTALDKYLARRHLWRIPEPILLLTSVLGGSLGVVMAMILVRHKTKKPLFLIAVPIMLTVQIAALCFLEY